VPKLHKINFFIFPERNGKREIRMVFSFQMNRGSRQFIRFRYDQGSLIMLKKYILSIINPKPFFTMLRKKRNQSRLVHWIRNSISLFLLLTFTLTNAQNSRAISGTVTDIGTNEPVVGATIIIRGTTRGTSTDVNGSFILQAATGDVLDITFLGYKPESVTVTESNEYIVAMEQDLKELSEVVVVGSRNQNRTVVDSPVPIDVINVASLGNTLGKVEINQILQYAAPSFNATKQSGSDGADHIDPASLRGLGPDQTLVLVNGKRRHQSSLVNIFGTRGRGNSGTDLNAIPASSIKRIEVLRDGASAQYGSDAIAGVINIVLKDANDGLTGGLTYGAYSTAIGDGWEAETGETLYNVEGKNRLDGEEKSFDGNTLKFDLNYGVPIGSKGGFANFTTEYLNKERTLRPGFSWRKGYGTAAVEGFNFMVNSVIPLNDDTDFYLSGGSNLRKTNANAFSRDSYADGDLRTVPSLYPNGFTPHITSDINDVSATGGIRHTLKNGWKVDFSNTFGKNNFHYYITGTNNASLKAVSPTDFDAGGHSLSMNVTNLDFSRYFEGVASGLNIAFGMENRAERFTIFAGEESSYSIYDNNGVAITNPALQSPATDDDGNELPGASQGFPGYSPDNEVNRGRSNFGLYADTELNVTENFLVSGALRFENYSDFGKTLNYKVASRYNFGDVVSVRGSVSSGFRAPSLAQVHYNLIFNNIVGGESVPSLLAANTSTVTKAFGIGPLQQETAFNRSLGATLKLGGFTATVDGYIIDVDDRIVLTDNFDATSLGLGVEAAQFFANGVDTKTQGVDIVLSYLHQFSSKSRLNVGLSGNFNDLEIEEIHNGDLNEYTFFGPFSQAYLKAAAPDYKIGGNIEFTISKFSINLFATQFSQVIIQDFQWVDSPATTPEEAEALYAVATDTYKKAMTVDLSLSFQFTSKLSMTVGGTNLFNKYPTPQFDTWTDQGGLMDSVQMGSDGAYFFGRVNFSL
jgi:iron complex outermembrane recepter protein